MSRFVNDFSRCEQLCAIPIVDVSTRKKTNIPVFIPFAGCPHHCSFCDQRAISGSEKSVTPDELDAFLSERMSFLEASGHAAEIAFFGGTFTAIDRNYMTDLLAVAGQYLRNYPGTLTGIRCSTRPDCVDEAVLDILKDCRVTAVELGAQSMDDEVLRKNRRGHTAADTVSAAHLIKSYGFELGLQMMTGLFGDTPELSRATANAIADLEPATVRVYPTVILPGTRLAELYTAGEYRTFGFEETLRLCADVYDLFTGRNIRVIRIGLNQAAKLKDSILGGVWHDTFGERVIARYYRRRILEKLAGLDKNGRYLICASKRYASKILGLRGENRDFFVELGYKLRFNFLETGNSDSILIFIEMVQR